ncbi:MAG: chromosome segregation protein SMC [Turicibacter sp.]|nr:chromosome segregation protein SMC [Turicibacter sp.]
MYLKRIEAIGFKSFATKTVINFDKGLTAIVGPNGSGKSNVSDSIRFVLGEQSVKSLRGGKMEDIIFAGTDTKKALNMAEVTIVLDNEQRDLPLDYSEISITRRVYRSGGGEYLINGEKVRLRDVTDLIMDSGIGHDSLSMISQDHVKQVVEGKSEDRRLILEESAGILKYKTRKKEAVRKLGYTNENLQRVKDIIGELELQIEPLRIQAKDAKEYLEVKEKLSDLEVRLLAHDIKVDNDQLTELKKENEELTVKQLALTKQINEGEETQGQRNDTHTQYTNDIQDWQFDLTSHAENVQKMRGEADVIRERLSNAGNNEAQLTGRKLELEEHLLRLQQEAKTAQTTAQDASRALYEKQQGDKEAYRQTHIVPLEEELKKTQETYRTLETELDALERERATLNDQNQHTTYQLSSAKSQLDFLQNAKEDFAGFTEGAKQVLRAKKSGRLQGIAGAVAELVTVPTEVETAMDVLLGPIASQIVTESDEFAKAGIQFLKENRFGRATFLPMNVIKSRRLHTDLLNKARQMNGFVSLASDALTFDETYRNIIENLVGSVVIAKDLNSANQMARAAGHRFRIVTLEGDVINPGGSMTGGAMNRKNNSSVLKQNQAITKQKELIVRLEEAMLDFEVKKQVVQTKIDLHQEDILAAKVARDNLQTKLNEANEQSLRTTYELRVEVATLEANLQNQMNEVRRLNDECERVESEIETVEETLENSDETRAALQKTLQQLEIDIEHSDQAKDAITEKIRDRRALLAQLTEELKTIDLSLREARRLAGDVNTQLNTLSGSIGKMDTKIDLAIEKLEIDYEMTFDYACLHYPLRADVAGARTEVQSLNRQLNRFGSVNIGAIDEYERVKERYDFLTNESEDLAEAANNLQASIDEMDTEMVIKFKETFDQVRVHYIETFQQLFGGGEADLVLSDPHDLLNTGVEIIARPPGTKLLTSNLLSGGQKALTSIAMLFAILKVRTIPFCILDEVEAALDEANVGRYATYLKQFSDQTQFIVITHRRGTMEESDVLYGVTMQERGITTMVSVNMASVDEYTDES